MLIAREVKRAFLKCDSIHRDEGGKAGDPEFIKVGGL